MDGIDVFVATSSGSGRWVCRWDRRAYRWAGGAVGIGDCVVSCLLGVSGVMTSQDAGGGSAGGESCCLGLSEGADPVTVVAAGVVWMHCTRVGCYWTRVGGTAGRWGLRAVRTTCGQWIPALVEQVDSRRDSRQSWRRTMTSGTLRRRRSGSGGGGPETQAPGCATKTPGLTPARPGVHSADMNEPAANVPSGDRWNPAVLLRRAAPMRL